MPLDLLRKTFRDFMDDDCPALAAAVSYYAIFALPALVVLILLVVSLFFDPAQVQDALRSQFGSLLGEQAGEEIGTMLSESERPGSNRGLAWVAGFAALLFSASGAFGQLQKALNRAWEVKPDPKQGGIRNFLLKRVLSLGMIMVIAFLMLVTLILSAALQQFGDLVGGMMGGLSGALLQALHLGISFVVITVLFATLFKVLPDAQIRWKDVRVGAMATAFLFILGKFLIGFYIGRSNPGEAFGAAASLAILLVWIYYASMILLFGAEFTQSWAESRGGGVRPESGAVRVVEEERPVRSEPVRPERAS